VRVRARSTRRENQIFLFFLWYGSSSLPSLYSGRLLFIGAGVEENQS